MLSSLAARAHCPAMLKEESVCFMLEKNLLYTYDSKFEHNGPYKDLETASLVELKDHSGKSLKYSKISRGILRIDSSINHPSVTAVFLTGKMKKEVKVPHE